jgi:hypothetical protein
MGWTGNSTGYSPLKWLQASSVQHFVATLSMALLQSNSSGIPCTSSAQHTCTHLVQLLLVDVVVVVRLRRHGSMRTPHGIEGAHQAGNISPLSKDWSKSWKIRDVMKTHSAAYCRSYRKHWEPFTPAHVVSTYLHKGLRR